MKAEKQTNLVTKMVETKVYKDTIVLILTKEEAERLAVIMSHVNFFGNAMTEKFKAVGIHWEYLTKGYPISGHITVPNKGELDK